MNQRPPPCQGGTLPLSYMPYKILNYMRNYTIKEKMRKSFLLNILLISLLSPQDLWVENDIYNSTLPVGSVVSVEFDVDFDIDLQNNLTKELNSSPLSREIGERFLDFLPATLAETLTQQNSDQIENRKQISGTLAATLGNYNPTSKTYEISISRNFFINNETESLTLSGVVAESAIGEDNIVSANQIANISFFFNSIDDSFNVTLNDFDNFDLSSTGITNVNNNQLNESKRQELFVKYFNWILKDLFN